MWGWEQGSHLPIKYLCQLREFCSINCSAHVDALKEADAQGSIIYCNSLYTVCSFILLTEQLLLHTSSSTPIESGFLRQKSVPYSFVVTCGFSADCVCARVGLKLMEDVTIGHFARTPMDVTTLFL